MTKRNPVTIEQVVDKTIDDVTAAAKAQGFIPDQQDEALWSLYFDNVRHIPDLKSLSDEDYAGAKDKYGRYPHAKAMLRDFGTEMPQAAHAAYLDIVKLYETHGESLVENSYRGALLAALAGGASLISAVGVAASSFVIGLTGSVAVANMSAVALIFAAAFAVFKYGEQLLDVLRWIADRIAVAIDTVCEWIAAGWRILQDTIDNFNESAPAAPAA